MLISVLLGKPVEHSFSPKLFAIYAQALGKMEYAHIKCSIEPENLADAVKGLVHFGFVGANVTLPYKMEVMQYLDTISDEAKAAGAVNTIKVEGTKLSGFNTDVFGAMEAIKQSRDQEVSTSDNALIFGSGGAARALVSGFLQKGCNITVLCRSPHSEKTKAFSEMFGDKVKILPYTDYKMTNLANFSLVCNATSLGMTPDINSSPLDLLEGSRVEESMAHVLFFDVVFNPQKTKFLAQGEALGAKLLGGTDMMIYQGVIAFELWTGTKVTPELITQAKDALAKQI